MRTSPRRRPPRSSRGSRRSAARKRPALPPWARALCLRHFPLLLLRRGHPTVDEVGRAGERIAARHLARCGWRLLGVRLRTPAGEVDLVAIDGAEVVCVEVKTGRRCFRGRGPGRRLGPRRLRRLGRSAAWLGAREGRRGRADLLEVIYGDRGPPEIRHLRDVAAPDRAGSGAAFLDPDGQGPLVLL